MAVTVRGAQLRPAALARHSLRLVGEGPGHLYGLALSCLRQRAGGLLAPWIAHLAADATIGLLALTTLT